MKIDTILLRQVGLACHNIYNLWDIEWYFYVKLLTMKHLPKIFVKYWNLLCNLVTCIHNLKTSSDWMNWAIKLLFLFVCHLDIPQGGGKLTCMVMYVDIFKSRSFSLMKSIGYGRNVTVCNVSSSICLTFDNNFRVIDRKPFHTISKPTVL